MMLLKSTIIRVEKVVLHIISYNFLNNRLASLFIHLGFHHLIGKNQKHITASNNINNLLARIWEIEKMRWLFQQDGSFYGTPFLEHNVFLVKGTQCIMEPLIMLLMVYVTEQLCLDIMFSIKYIN